MPVRYSKLVCCSGVSQHVLLKLDVTLNALNVEKVFRMCTCPRCGNGVDVTSKKFENAVFCLAMFICPKCGNNFKTAF
jgi:transposase-like protein